MEGSRPRQRLGTGPVTGPLERPSQGAPENRKADTEIRVQRRPSRDVIKGARRAVVSLSQAEMQVLVAAQRDERQRTLAAVEGGLRSQHASQTAAIVGRFADRRAAVFAMIDNGGHGAVLARLAAEETAELARLAVEQAGERRRLRQSTLAALSGTHRAARRSLRTHHRHQQLTMAVHTRHAMPQPAGFVSLRSRAPRLLAPRRRPPIGRH